MAEDKGKEVKKEGAGPSSGPGGKKDYSTAILERKKSPNRLVVDDAVRAAPPRPPPPGPRGPGGARKPLPPGAGHAWGAPGPRPPGPGRPGPSVPGSCSRLVPATPAPGPRPRPRRPDRPGIASRTDAREPARGASPARRRQVNDENSVVALSTATMEELQVRRAGPPARAARPLPPPRIYSRYRPKIAQRPEAGSWREGGQGRGLGLPPPLSGPPSGSGGGGPPAPPVHLEL